jgi:hypothetical protein
VSTALRLADLADLEPPSVALPDEDPRFIHRHGALRTVIWRPDDGDDPPPRKERPAKVYPPKDYSAPQILRHPRKDGTVDLTCDLTPAGLCIEPEQFGLFTSALAGLGQFRPSMIFPALRLVPAASVDTTERFFLALLLKHCEATDATHPPAVEGVAALRRRMSELSEPQ